MAIPVTIGDPIEWFAVAFENGDMHTAWALRSLGVIPGEHVCCGQPSFPGLRNGTVWRRLDGATDRAQDHDWRIVMAHARDTDNAEPELPVIPVPSAENPLLGIDVQLDSGGFGTFDARGVPGWVFMPGDRVTVAIEGADCYGTVTGGRRVRAINAAPIIAAARSDGRAADVPGVVPDVAFYVRLVNDGRLVAASAPVSLGVADGDMVYCVAPSNPDDQLPGVVDRRSNAIPSRYSWEIRSRILGGGAPAEPEPRLAPYCEVRFLSNDSDRTYLYSNTWSGLEPGSRVMVETVHGAVPAEVVRVLTRRPVGGYQGPLKRVVSVLTPRDQPITQPPSMAQPPGHRNARCHLDFPHVPPHLVVEPMVEPIKTKRRINL